MNELISPQDYVLYVTIPSFIGVMAWRIYDAVKTNWNKHLDKITERSSERSE